MSEISDLRERLATLTRERRGRARLCIIGLLTTDSWVTKPRRGFAVEHPRGGMPVRVLSYADGWVTYADHRGKELKADLYDFVMLHSCPGLTLDMWMDYNGYPR